MQLGGSMSLHGNHMTLACFHGPNFRSKSWVLFHLEEPNIAFWTEAQKIWEDGTRTYFMLWPIIQLLDSDALVLSGGLYLRRVDQS